MNYLVVLFLSCSFGISAQVWHHDLDSAKRDSLISNKLILLNFSGSDWCIPCKKLKAGLLRDSVFICYADTALMLINADFPTKKNAISKEQLAKNEALAEKYNPKGSFPYTVLLNPLGDVLAKWTGLIEMSASAFVNQIESFRISK